MPVWVREGINGSAELAEVPSPTLDPLGYFHIRSPGPGRAPAKPENPEFPHPSIPSRGGEGK